MTVFEIAAIAVGLVALVMALSLVGKVGALTKKLDSIPDDGNIFEAIRRLDADLGAAEDAIGRLQPAVRSLAERMPGAIRHTAVLSYDAHHDLAGRCSRSIALLDERGNGLVLTMMVGRAEAIYYTKMIRGGRGTEPLSPEEANVVRIALGG